VTKFEDLPHECKRYFRLENLMHEEKVNIIGVQETHTVSEEYIRRRGTMPGYVFIEVIYNSVHGIAT
jgi:transcription antitermination factor NusG